MHQTVGNSAFSATLFLLFLSLSLSCSQYVCQSFRLILPSTVSPPRTSSSSASSASFASQQPNQQHIMPRQEKGKLNCAEEMPLVSLISRPPVIVTAVTLEATGTITAASSSDSGPSSPVEGTTANPSTWSLISAVPRAKLAEFCLLTILLLTFFLLLCFLLLFWEQTSQPEVVKDLSTHRLLTLKTRLALKSETTGQVIINAYGNCQLTLDVSDLMIKCTSINSKGSSSKETWKLIPNRSHSTSSDFAFFRLQSLGSKLFCLAAGSPADGFHLTVDLCEQADRPVAEQVHLLFNLTVEGISIKQSCVFFSIRSAEHPNQCMGFHLNFKLDKVFRMERCSGLLSQLFYIGAVDYGEELAKYRKWIQSSNPLLDSI